MTLPLESASHTFSTRFVCKASLRSSGMRQLTIEPPPIKMDIPVGAFAPCAQPDLGPLMENFGNLFKAPFS